VEGASDQEEYWQVSRGNLPSPIAVDSLVPPAVDVGGLLLTKGKVDHQTACALDPFQEEEEDGTSILVPFQAVVSAHPTADNKWVA
jgi:hypothetical protein